MNLEFSSINLNKKQYKFLKSLKNKSSLTTSLSKVEIKSLKALNLIRCVNFEESIEKNIPRVYSLTEKGSYYVDYLRKDIFRFALPVILSVIAILISIYSLWLQLS